MVDGLLIFLIIQLILTSIIISLTYFIYLFIISLDLPLTQPLLGLAEILLTFYLTFIISILLLALIHKICRLLLHDEVGELTGISPTIWAVKQASWDIVQTFTRKFLIHSPLPDVLVTLFGFKRRKGTSILGELMDPELLQIGSGTMVGTSSIISGHHIRRGKLYRAKVKIGDNCTIGGYTIILPGVEIGDNVVVGAVSLVPAHWKLESNSIYSGVPVKKVKTLNEEDI